MVFLDFIFPPLCVACKERCSTKFLCPDCWSLCELPDPVERCRHCFEEMDRRGGLCAQCLQKPFLPVIRAYVFDPASPAKILGLEAIDAMAGFAFVQWTQLEWDVPDAIIPMPDRDSVAIGKTFSRLMDLPFIRALESDFTYKEDRLEEEQTLLIFDVANRRERLLQASLALSESFPKITYLLSLHSYASYLP